MKKAKKSLNAYIYATAIMMTLTLFGQAGANAATVQWHETFTALGHNFTLDFTASDTTGTVITSLLSSSNVDGFQLFVSPIATYNTNNNLFDPSTASTGGWSGPGITFNTSAALSDTSQYWNLLTIGLDTIINAADTNLNSMFSVSTTVTTTQQSPAPIPAALFMFAPGVLGLLRFSKRRKKQTLPFRTTPTFNVFN